MRKVGLILGLALVGFACADSVGQMLEDAGQMMQDGSLSDADASTMPDGSTGTGGTGGTGPRTTVNVVCDRERVFVAESRNSSDGTLRSTTTNTTYYALLDVPDPKEVITEICYADGKDPGQYTYCPENFVSCSGLLSGEFCYVNQGGQVVGGKFLVSCGYKYEVDNVDPDQADALVESRATRVVVYY